ncbi:phage antirepressor KilAC domain-containing protein [Lihuaxuella thermophila]|uniref:Prophage antirepressor n=1 Tax=Lihuaxuella thermophila TaxID=1173111 RepID=A0A1H8H9U8_9BACL|nr:phage antirepressor [Lihuaxuella thermophila]SEN53101.1 Prophage antirepressor [Lihuaxuella thermophila]
MNQLSRVFDYQGSQLRTIIKDGEPWFVAKDVCDVLEISDARQAVGRLDEDERCLIPVTDSLGRQQNTFAVNEPGLYSLILGSRKPEAKAFKRWITHEVIPSIRKTGQYSVNESRFQIPQTLPEALRLAADLAEEKERLEQENRVLAPKAESFDTFMSADNAQPIGTVAKALGIGPNKLFARLREEKILMSGNRDKKNLPYQEYIDRGYFRVKETPIVMGDKTINRTQTLVTPKGVDWIAGRLGLKKNLPAVPQ